MPYYTRAMGIYLIEVQRAAAALVVAAAATAGPSSGEIASCMCLHCGRMRYKCIAHSSATPAVRMDNCCTADSATNNVSAAKQRRARVQRCDLVLMKNDDDDCLCWEATLGALISHAAMLSVNGWEMRAVSLFVRHINKHIYQGSDARGVSCAGWERAQVGHYGNC